MTHTATEVASQPRVWRIAADRTAAELAPILTGPGPLAVVGCGTSWHIAAAISALREAAGFGVTDAYTASEARLDRGYPQVLALSRSGTTTEILRLVASVRPGTRVSAVVGTPDSPLAQVVDQAITLEYADEASVVQTRFATTALAAARSALGEDVEPLAVAAEQALAAPLPPVLDARQVVFLGSAWAVGLADEAALKLREAALHWTESYPAAEYRHGPIALAQPDAAVWVLGDAPDGLADAVRATGAVLVDDPLDPMVDLVRVHRVAVELATARGLDPDRPRHLSRSVVLDGAGR